MTNTRSLSRSQFPYSSLRCVGHDTCCKVLGPEVPVDADPAGAGRRLLPERDRVLFRLPDCPRGRCACHARYLARTAANSSSRSWLLGWSLMQWSPTCLVDCHYQHDPGDTSTHGLRLYVSSYCCAIRNVYCASLPWPNHFPGTNDIDANQSRREADAGGSHLEHSHAPSNHRDVVYALDVSLCPLSGIIYCMAL